MRNMLPAKIACISSILLLFTLYSFAQDIVVSGKVSNNNGEPLAGATIRVKGTNRSNLTKDDGTFQVTVPSARSVIVISHTGFKDQEVTAGAQKDISISMTPAASSLDEVVVVGYG